MVLSHDGKISEGSLSVQVLFSGDTQAFGIFAGELSVPSLPLILVGLPPSQISHLKSLSHVLRWLNFWLRWSCEETVKGKAR